MSDFETFKKSFWHFGPFTRYGWGLDIQLLPNRKLWFTFVWRPGMYCYFSPDATPTKAYWLWKIRANS